MRVGCGFCDRFDRAGFRRVGGRVELGICKYRGQATKIKIKERIIRPPLRDGHSKARPKVGEFYYQEMIANLPGF